MDQKESKIIFAGQHNSQINFKQPAFGLLVFISICNHICEVKSEQSSIENPPVKTCWKRKTERETRKACKGE